MKYLLIILSSYLVGWPAVVVGYLWCAIRSGFAVGYDAFVDHSRVMLEKFPKKS